MGLFGEAVSLSGDGDTAMVGAPNAHSDRGAVWVFARTGSGWRQQGQALTGAGEQGNIGEFGGTIALSANGDVAAISGPGDNDNVGAFWVFGRTVGIWKQQGPKLTARDEVGRGGFGISVALSRTGETVLIGGWQDNHGRGAVWLFQRSGTRWRQVGPKHTAPDERGAEGHYGAAVALSASARTALVSGGLGNHKHGAAWIFTAR